MGNLREDSLKASKIWRSSGLEYVFVILVVTGVGVHLDLIGATCDTCSTELRV